MSRSQKKKKKQQRNIKIVIGIVVVVAIVGVLYGLGVIGQKVADEIIPDTEEQMNVNVYEGQNNGQEKTGVGDVTDGKTHDLPYYLEVMLGNEDAPNPILNGEKPHSDEVKKEEVEQESKKEGDSEESHPNNPKEDAKDKEDEKDSPTNTPPENNPEKPLNWEEEGYLEVHFIDVGQGDASLIKFVDTNTSNGDDSAAMLVDAGDGNSGTLVRNYISKQGVKNLTYFVCTHPDADHIGGAASVVSNVKITSEIVWGPQFEKDTKTYENLMNEIQYKWYKYEEPSYGKEYDLGLATFTFVAPTEKHEDVNSNSLVFRIEYGDDSFLMVGDCEEEEEVEIVNGSYAKYIDSDVLKVGHHGSKTSSSEAFLKLVTPEYAVISCGEGNKYFHPHAAALNNLRAVGAELFRTDVQGSLIATTYGKGITWNASPCNDWASGE